MVTSERILLRLEMTAGSEADLSSTHPQRSAKAVRSLLGPWSEGTFPITASLEVSQQRLSSALTRPRGPMTWLNTARYMHDCLSVTMLGHPSHQRVANGASEATRAHLDAIDAEDEKPRGCLAVVRRTGKMIMIRKKLENLSRGYARNCHPSHSSFFLSVEMLTAARIIALPQHPQ